MNKLLTHNVNRLMQLSNMNLLLHACRESTYHRSSHALNRLSFSLFCQQQSVDCKTNRDSHLKCEHTSLLYQQYRMAGHSKWANIKHTKAAKDQHKAVLFGRIAFQIRKAVYKQGGPDPRLNKELADVIAAARRSNVPTALIERSIKKALEKQPTAMQVELIGPSGSLFIVQAESFNVTTLKTDIRKIIKKYPGFGFAPPNRMEYCFEGKGVVKVSKVDKDGQELSIEKAEEIAIEAEAEEVQQDDDDDTIIFITNDLDMEKVKRYIQEKTNLELIYADNELIPVTRMPVEEKDKVTISEVIEKIEAHEDVVRVYDNIR